LQLKSFLFLLLRPHWGLSFLGLALCAFASFAQNKSLHELSQWTGQDRQSILIAGAKKEGELNVYHAHPIVQTIADAFTQTYGIKVKTWRAGSEAIQQRVISEQRAGKFDIDLVSNTAIDTEALYKERLLQEVNSPVFATLIEKALPAHKHWAAFNLDIYSGAFNTKLYKKEDMPKTYDELLQPKWRDQLGIEANDHVWFGALLAELGEERGKKLFDQINSTNGLSVRKGHSLLSTMVASGEVPIALTVYNWNPAVLRKKGAPIDVFWISPLLALPSSVAVMSKAPHPYSALLFYDYVLNEGQRLVAEAGYAATSKKIDTIYSSLNVKVIDAQSALQQQDRWFKLYADMLAKRNK
jgi:iron(III) transport system substrate-binding protein